MVSISADPGSNATFCAMTSPPWTDTAAPSGSSLGQLFYPGSGEKILRRHAADVLEGRATVDPDGLRVKVEARALIAPSAMAACRPLHPKVSPPCLTDA